MPSQRVRNRDLLRLQVVLKHDQPHPVKHVKAPERLRKRPDVPPATNGWVSVVSDGEAGASPDQCGDLCFKSEPSVCQTGLDFEMLAAVANAALTITQRTALADRPVLTVNEKVA